MFPWFVGGACDDFISGELHSEMESIEAELEKILAEEDLFSDARSARPECKPDAVYRDPEMPDMIVWYMPNGNVYIHQELGHPDAKCIGSLRHFGFCTIQVDCGCGSPITAPQPT